MKKICFVLGILLFFFPTVCWGYDSQWAQTSARDTQMATMAENLPQFRQDDGSYWMMCNEETRALYAPEALTINVEKPLLMTVVNTVFHHSDFKEVQMLLEDYHRTYFSSIASGTWHLADEALFANTEICDEANARSLVMMFIYPGSGSGTQYGDFGYHIDSMKFADDLCKVMITRYAEVIDKEYDGRYSCIMEEAVREGFLLEKKEGQWKIANILFDTSDSFAGDADRIFSDDYTSVNMLNLFADAADPSTWRKGFDIKHCPREIYSIYGNYRSYLIGDGETLTFDYNKLVMERESLSLSQEPT